jgi:hypothetical protein
VWSSTPTGATGTEGPGEPPGRGREGRPRARVLAVLLAAVVLTLTASGPTHGVPGSGRPVTVRSAPEFPAREYPGPGAAEAAGSGEAAAARVAAGAMAGKASSPEAGPPPSGAAAPEHPGAAKSVAVGTGGRSLCGGRPARVYRFATGELRIYRNKRSACALTLARNPGRLRPMSVLLQARGGRPVVHEGRFRKQAGPVGVAALNRCIRAVGAVSGTSRSSGWILC